MCLRNVQNNLDIPCIMDGAEKTTSERKKHHVNLFTLMAVICFICHRSVSLTAVLTETSDDLMVHFNPIGLEGS